LREEAWDSVYNSDDVNGMFNNFHCILVRYFGNSFPITYKSYRNKQNNWITEGIRISCKRKRDLYTIYKHTNNIQVKEYYKKYCAILKEEIIDAKKQCYNKQIEHSSNRVKTTWKITKVMTGKTQSPDNNLEINSDAVMLTNINETANAFNSYCVNIAENLNNKLFHVDKALQWLKKSYPENILEMKVIPVTEIEVIEIIKSFKNKNSSGYDGISINILKHCVNAISKPLTFICNLSLATGVYPDRFKFAVV
jgi:hypothetical protein